MSSLSASCFGHAIPSYSTQVPIG